MRDLNSPGDGTVRKAIRIIESLVEAQDGMGLSELSRVTNLNKATAHRILSVLREAGFVRQGINNRQYTLGLRLVQLGAHVLENIGIPKIARPHMIELMRETKHSIHLAILEDSTLVYIGKIEAPEGVTLRTRVGSTPPIHVTAVGKCLLAFLPLEEREALFAQLTLNSFTSNTIKNRSNFRRHLEEIKRLGYAVDNEEHRIGIRCIAAPIFDVRDRVAAAVSIAGPVFTITKDLISTTSELVMRCAHNISCEIGHVSHVRLAQAETQKPKPSIK